MAAAEMYEVVPLKVLELYSGIGESGLQFEVIAAIDINTVTNDIYRHNFPQTRLINKGIETVKLKEFNKLAPDMILMSPPCQPFARVGKQKDVEDPRTKSFLHLLSIISRLDKPVSYILVENVKGFDTSEAHTQLLQTLKADYNIQEFLLSPLQCGVPNSRLRYYMLAKRKPCAFAFPCPDEIWTEFPRHVLHLLSDIQLSEKDSSVLESAEVPVNTADHTFADKEEKIKDNGTDNCCDSRDLDECDMPLYRKYSSICHPLREYLENGPPESFIPFMVPEKFFHRFWVMDIVKPEMKNCCCFTKRYGHHIEGAGSVIQTNMKSTVDLAKYKATRKYCDETHESVRDLKLRFFSPREIANLMHFPAKFCFPEGVSTIQCYRVLGNSLNVHVVAVLLRLMLKENS